MAKCASVSVIMHLHKHNCIFIYTVQYTSWEEATMWVYASTLRCNTSTMTKSPLFFGFINLSSFKTTSCLDLSYILSNVGHGADGYAIISEIKVVTVVLKESYTYIFKPTYVFAYMHICGWPGKFKLSRKYDAHRGREAVCSDKNILSLQCYIFT